MAITIDWATKIISVPQADLTDLGGGLYELDVNQFRKDLKALEASEDGILFPDTHTHKSQTTLSGDTYARIIEIINGYTVEFEDGQYTVKCVNANHNIADVKVANQVSLIIGNAAGLIQPQSYFQDSDRSLLTYASDMVYRKQAIVDGMLVTYDDDGVTPLYQHELKDVDGNPVKLEPGQPAQRGSAQ